MHRRSKLLVVHNASSIIERVNPFLSSLQADSSLALGDTRRTGAGEGKGAPSLPPCAQKSVLRLFPVLMARRVLYKVIEQTKLSKIYQTLVNASCGFQPHVQSHACGTLRGTESGVHIILLLLLSSSSSFFFLLILLLLIIIIIMMNYMNACA